MATVCKFHFNDILGGEKTRQFVHTSDVLSEVETGVAAMTAALDAIVEGGVRRVTIFKESSVAATTPDAGSNVDEGMTLTVLQANGKKKAVKIPTPIQALRLAGHGIDTNNADLIAFIGLFSAPGVWRVNEDNPQSISQLVSGSLDL